MIYQMKDSDCGVACVQMVLGYYGINNRGVTSLANVIDGVQIRTIEAFFREKGCLVISGNMDIDTLRYYVKRKIPIIILFAGHYVVLVGFANRSVHYNCPLQGPKSLSISRFKKLWFNILDGACLFNWGIVVYV
jgi:ABC-type bacteriocin/lantibiotic exporter with double-glycine peptidase domain